ncbi:MAG: PorT family protein [Prolixibacteraceae bacterium]|nr:PorT family protein [Prolixibacteraceae bacterium]
MTKKTILFAVGLIVISNLTAFSQNFKFGLIAGLDIANAHLTNKPEGFGDNQVYYPMIAYNFNGYIGYKKSELWGLSIEPGFIQKGGRQKSSDDYIRFNLNYLQLPILFDYYIVDKFYVSIGPELSYMINAKAKSKDNSNDITDLYDRRFELSGLVGINYRIIDKLDIGLRYNHGFTYTSKITWTDKFGESIGESKDYNQHFQLFVKLKI